LQSPLPVDRLYRDPAWNLNNAQAHFIPGHVW
jgi:hypothetical protein